MECSEMNQVVSKCQSMKIIPSLEDTLRSKGLIIELDEATEKWFQQLELIWKTWKRSSIMENSIEGLYQSRLDAFRVALVFVIKCQEFSDCKPKSLPFFLIEILMKYSLKNNIFADESLKMPAFHIAIHQRNQHFLSLMVKTFQIATIKAAILPLVKDMIKNDNSKQASQIVIAMELFDDIPVEDLLFPLVLLDKPNMIDDYLTEAPSQIKNFLLFLDRMLDKNFKINDFVHNYAHINNIGHVKHEKLHQKPLGKLVARLCQKFNVPVETCKNLSNNRTASGLRYLVHRKYNERSIASTVWDDLVKDSLNQNSDAIHPFIDLLVDYDIAEALKWARHFNVPEALLPLALRGATAPAPEENWETEVNINTQDFYKCPLTIDKITIIESGEQFYELISLLHVQEIVSMDCEWKPSFGATQSQVAIIQLGTKDMAYLIDTIVLNQPQYAIIWQSFNKSFLENAEIIKLGFGLEQDLREMKASIIGLNNIKVKGEGFLDLSVLWKSLVDNELTLPDCSDKGFSLSALVQTCFEKPLEKSEQCSNWELRPLRQTQIKYAATDADVLIRIYLYLQNRCQQQGINFEEICNYIMDEGVKKNSRKTKPAFHPPVLPLVEAKPPAKVKILLDAKLQYTMACLRYCGIDTICRPDSVMWHHVINLATSDERIVIVTKPKNTPNKSFPQRSILCVGSEPLVGQLHKIIKTYNLSIQQNDLLTICLYCNSKDLNKLNSDQVEKLCTAYEIASNERQNSRMVHAQDDENDEVDFGDFLSDSDDDMPRLKVVEKPPNQTCITTKGVQVVIENAPQLKTSKKSAILCEDCGRLTSDEDALLKTVREIVKKVTNLTPIT